MGLLKNIIDLVKEELLDEPKKPAKKSGSQKASTSKPKGDSFEQLCVKAKAGDLAAQFNLYDQYADKADKREALEALFTEMMNNGDVEGKGMLACLIVQNASNYSNEKVAQANKWADEAFAACSLIVTVMNGFYFACPYGLRRDWDPGTIGISIPHPTIMPEGVIVKLPVNPQQAIVLLEGAANKLKTCSSEAKAAYHLVYGYLAYNYWCITKANDKIIAHANQGAELEDPLSLFVLGMMCWSGHGGYEKNTDYALQYFQKAEKFMDKLGEEGPLHDTFVPWIYCMIGAAFDKQKNDNSSKKAASYFEKAAKKGSLYAMFALSRYHELGILPKDPEKILAWKTKALAGGFDMNRFNPPAYSI
jgi:TPR repeat protein